MCGRFRLEISPKDIIGFYKLIDEIDKKYRIQKDILNLKNDLSDQLATKEDIYPTNTPLIISTQSLENMKWGFPLEDKLLVNGRSEKLQTSPFYKKLLKEKRCLIPATSFYEWNQKRKYEIALNNPFFFMAGLYNEFLDEYNKIKNHFIILTTDADKDMSKIHHRMPCIIENENLTKFLKSSDENEVINLLKPWNKGLNITLGVGEQISFLDI